MAASTRRVLRFTAPRTVEVETEPIPIPAANEVRVSTELSAVSPGTEMLIYRGEAPSTHSTDTSLQALSGKLDFPLTYGYAAVGRVDALGKNVSENWRDQRVFSFQPHVSHFATTTDQLVCLPETVSFADGVMIPSLETAVTFIMDGHPMIGEEVVVFGQGVIGLLTTKLLSRHPLGFLCTVEPNSHRRQHSIEAGADYSFAPTELSSLHTKLDLEHAGAQEAEGNRYEGADLVFELSGKPRVLNHALALTGFEGHLVIGSWYGTKNAPINLGDRFHRSRITISSSQVSTVSSSLRGRWTKERRMRCVLSLLPTIEPSELTQPPFSISEAKEIYRRLEQEDEDLLQPVFHYN